MHHSGMSHRACSQLTRVLSLDFKNEIIIFTHIGHSWMTESDPNGWETYSELPTERFQHQYFDDTNLIKNMVFDLDVPTIGAIPGPGFHWDSAMLCDVTIASEDTWMEVPHAHGGLVPGDGMGLHDDRPPVDRPADAGLGYGQRSRAQGQGHGPGLGDRPDVEDHAL